MGLIWSSLESSFIGGLDQHMDHMGWLIFWTPLISPDEELTIQYPSILIRWSLKI